MDLYMFGGIGNIRGGDVEGYTGEGQHGEMLMNDYAGYSLDVPLVMPIEPAYVVPEPPPYNVSASTVSTTTTGSTRRRMLTDDDRRRIREYHKDKPYAKQT